jgi:hypothetical protein
MGLAMKGALMFMVGWAWKEGLLSRKKDAKDFFRVGDLLGWLGYMLLGGRRDSGTKARRTRRLHEEDWY